MIVPTSRTDVTAEDRGDGVTELHFRPETRAVRLIERGGINWAERAIAGALFIFVVAFWALVILIARGVI